MSIQLFISGMILGVLLGMLLYSSVRQGQQYREEKQRDIDRLIEQFQGLFRQIDREKKQSP